MPRISKQTKRGQYARRLRRAASQALAAICAVPLFFGCAPADGGGEEAAPRTVTVFAMDTVMDISVYGGPESLTADAEDLIRGLEAAFSVTDPDSEIYAVNREGAGPVGSDTEALLAEALRLCGRTGGKLDCTIYPVLRAWGFTTGDYRIPSRRELDALLTLVDWRAVTLTEGSAALKQGQMLDLGAVAKGYTGDRLIGLFREAGVTSAIVNLGGNVQTLGTRPDGSPWRVAVADPFGEGYAGVVETADRAVITSGGYERYFEEDGKIYRHILDPETGIPVDNGLVSVTVVGERGVLCDGLSTALFVMGEEDAAEFWRDSDDFDAILLTEDGRVLVTEGLERNFSPLGSWRAAPVTVIRRGED